MRGLILILFFVVFCGCESALDLDIPGGYDSQLVIQSHFTPDSLWEFRVGKSAPVRGTIDPNELIVPDAKIVIFGEDRFRETLHYVGHGIYQTAQGQRPIRGISYTVQVSATGFPQAEASSWAPPLKSKLLEVKRTAKHDSLGTEDYELRFELEDQPGSNYYRMALHQVVPLCEREGWGIFVEDVPGNVIDYWRLVFQSNSTSFRDYIETVDDPTIPYQDDDFWGPYFSDKLFEATTKEFKITFEATIFESIHPHFSLVLSSLSEDMFVFERSIVLHDLFLAAPSIAQSNPAVVHTNVVNGLGIFAGYTNDTYRFDAAGEEWQEDVLGIGIGEIQSCK